MAPRKSQENAEGIAVEVEDPLPEAEKAISYDPALANAADTQQLGVFRLMYTNINDVYYPL
jgi:hypothetical protein